MGQSIQTTSQITDYRIELDQILAVYRRVLDYGCLLVSGFFQKTVATQDGTLAIGKDGTFYYCPEWCKEWLTNPTKFNDGILHEMLHPVIGDMSREMSYLRNFSSDSIINSMIFNLGLSQCELMEEFYPKSEAAAKAASTKEKQIDPACTILRPNAEPPAKLQGLYERLYPTNVRSYDRQQAPSTLEISDALRIIYADKMKTVVLIGSHEGSLPTKTMDGEPISPDDLGLPAEVQTSVAEAMADGIEKGKYGRPGAGYNPHLQKMYIEVLRAKASLKRKVYEGFVCQENITKLKGSFVPAEPEPSVVPKTISRRDALLIAQGVMPIFYNVADEVEDEMNGLHVYMDVSGSVWDELPKALGVLRALNDVIDVVYQFSNKVVRTSISELVNAKEAKIDTTGGTDFNCVIEHAIAHGVKKALIFTDGDAPTSKENQEKALKKIEKMGLIYFGNWQNRENWLHQQYKIFFEISDLIQGGDDV